MKLRIEKPIYGGAGLARHEGKAIFVPFTLAGELVEARPADDHGTYASAELESVVDAAPQRIPPLCPYFADCGGCHYQHADYAYQIEIKSRILRETLERAHLDSIPDIDTAYAEPFHYRNRIRMHIDPSTSKLCYKFRSSHRNLAVEVCPIAAPVLEQALKQIQAAAPAWKLGLHFSEIELFTNPAQDSVLITMWTAGDAQSAVQQLESFWPELKTHVPHAVGVAFYSAMRGRQPGKLLGHAGEQSLTYPAAGQEYVVSIGSFFQVNRFLIDRLVEAVTNSASGKLAWDLYAGVGLFSAALAPRFEQIVAVESGSASVRDLRRNLRGKQHRIVASSVLDFLRRARSASENPPDFVIVDPPRAGLGKEITNLLAAARPTRITYVSCDPATLARDLKSLLDSGYHLSHVRMVDLFPQTFHLESIAMLSFK